MRKTLLLVFLLACSKEEQRKEELAAAQASASAAAAAESAALAKVLASASVAPPPVKQEAPAGEWITAQHILVAYKGAKACPRGVTRTKDEAKKRAQEARDKLAKDPKLDFTDLVNIYTDDNATKDRQGSLGKIKKENVVKEFGDAAWALKVDEVSDVVETPFGFHIIKRNQ